MNFSVVKISSLIDSVGESEVVSALSEFKCEKNPEIENFIKNNAVEFAKRKISVTHLILDDEGQISAYFTNKKPLLDFYQNENNRFRVYGERFSKSENTNYIQLLRFF